MNAASAACGSVLDTIAKPPVIKAPRIDNILRIKVEIILIYINIFFQNNEYNNLKLSNLIFSSTIIQILSIYSHSHFFKIAKT